MVENDDKGKNENGVFVSLDEAQSEKHGILFRWLRSIIGREPSSKTEIQQVLDESEERGLIDQDEGDMIDGIFELKETVAREIMIPRTHIVAVPSDCALEQLLNVIIESGHSRIPVYGESLDQITGILNAKDLLPLWLNSGQEFNVDAISRPPYFVPETKPIKDLLNELRSKKSHLTVIVDEYGGTSGIVTIEDIVEEIIGDIRDEHDVEEDVFVHQEDGSVLVNARANLDDFEELFGVDVPRGGYDSLGGFIIHMLGKVPNKGDDVSFGELHMEIEEGDEKCITSVLVVPTSELESDSAACLSEPAT
jgi:CBS domain containing-hemolysin-like protein